MAPTKRKTKHKPEITKVGEEVLDLVIPYIHNVDDRNSVSLVSRKFYEIDGITRKRITVHTLYYRNPASLSKRFPFIESLTLKGPPYVFCDVTNFNAFTITPWIEQLALEFRCLKELHIRRLSFHGKDLETLARTCGKDLRTLKIKKCIGFSTEGLMDVSKYCNQLTTLCLRYSHYDNVKNGIWLHQLALNSTVLERLHVPCVDVSNNEIELTLLARNCCNSLISLKIGKCYLSKLGDAFRYAVRLNHFGGYNWDQESDLVGFKFPPSMRSLSIKDFSLIPHRIVLPCLNQIRTLKLVSLGVGHECQCLLFRKCPNLEVLYNEDKCGDTGLQVIGQFCKKLRKLNHNGFVTQVGLIALEKGCTNLECLEVRLEDISNEAIKCLGTHLKNLRKFRMHLVKKDGTTDLPLDNGIRDMLMGCSKLERLHMSLRQGGLTDVGLEYIGAYGVNLRSLSVTHIRKSEVGLVKLSKGCPNLIKLKLMDCPLSKQAVSGFVFNMPSLRYVSLHRCDHTVVALLRPEFRL